ncbi:hypothetical protein [Limnoglobus roseus]|uniref:Uncharacterized protein n=1 Tax=Limnoglobus roseus TaxID=2598579 RepID=A0A5C1AM40_9BACT|nr:hypothetical protein [Limnoglobus roseus]QEL19233.1 hypothetical protein PX52LOC_06295 [Limnoglobus roseus]
MRRHLRHLPAIVLLFGLGVLLVSEGRKSARFSDDLRESERQSEAYDLLAAVNRINDDAGLARYREDARLASTGNDGD